MTSPASRSAERARKIRFVLWAILVANWAVAALKLVYGLASGSAALSADGLHSFIDGGSNVIGLVAMWIAAQPADENHPYGHEKFEALAALAIGAMIGIGMFELGRMSFSALVANSRPEVSNTMLIVTVGTLLVNVVVTRIETAQGKKLNSTILLADAQHTLSDVFVSLVVIVSLVLSRLEVPRADGLVGLAVLGFVARAGWMVIRQAVEPLSDTARLDRQSLEALCLAVPGVRRVHHIRSRGMAESVQVDLKIDVDRAQSLADAHKVADAVEAAIIAAHPQVNDVMVHVEPAA